MSKLEIQDLAERILFDLLLKYNLNDGEITSLASNAYSLANAMATEKGKTNG